MTEPTHRHRPIAFAALALALAACTDAPQDKPHDPEPPPPTNRIAVPASVRQNLGIRFVAAERRKVAATLRLPGHFELLPQGRREYRTPIAGRVEVQVEPLQAVAEGAVLYRIDAPEWHRMRRELGELYTAQTVARARIATMAPLLAAHEQHAETLATAVTVMQERIGVLEETRRSVGGQGEELAQARVQLAQVRADLAEAEEKHAELQARVAEGEAEVLAGADRIQLALTTAAAITSWTPAELLAEQDGVPAWRRLTVLEVRAVAAGIADALPVASGAWTEVGDLVVAVTDPRRVRFRARGLQSDLGRMRDGLPARVVPAAGSPTELPSLQGLLQLGVDADPAQRTIDVFVAAAEPPAWARPGVAAFVEIETRSSAAAELAIPQAAVLQDGLQRVFFRRDHKNPDQVIRIEADLGVDDGRWVEVKSGLADGDTVVLDGAYELVLASSGSVTKGGHFHADGTFHSDEDH
ncbi:MAG: efflux RND transporter periplasmic adaptor subunit [Planctomycetota bacterium]